ncbi:MAG: ATPase [Herpetosiphon sp.]
MPEKRPKTVLCLASYEKGEEFMRACKAQGWRVLLITTHALRDVPWPREAIDRVFPVADLYHREHVIYGVSYLARSEQIDLIVPMDDFDVEVAATLREHLRMAGMGESEARFYRDKLAMRGQALKAGIEQPGFTAVFNYDRLREWMEQNPAPWLLKPRSEASSVGIKRIGNAEQLWRALETLGDRQSFYLLEQYIPGDVYHVDGISMGGTLLFAETNRYAHPLLDVTQGGGLFCSRTLPRGGDEEAELRRLTAALLSANGFRQGVTHTEFIRGKDGRFRFVETSARVGGAHIAEMIEAATGVNLWREWALTEMLGEEYCLPVARKEYGGIVVSLSRQEQPNLSPYQAPEIKWRMNRRHHAGLVVASPDRARIDVLLDEYQQRFRDDFYTSLPEPDHPTS